MMTIADDERPASLGVKGALAREAVCQSAVLAQAAATLPPSAQFCHQFCVAFTKIQQELKKKKRWRGMRKCFGRRNQALLCAYLDRVIGTLLSRLRVVGRPASLYC